MTKKFMAILMAMIMALSFSTVVFAAEETEFEEMTVSETSADNVRATATTYVSSSSTVNISTDITACNKNMGWGTYTVTYSVSQPANLYLWIDGMTSIQVATLSGSGSTTVSVPLFTTYRYWQLWAVSNSGNLTYSISITK